MDFGYNHYEKIYGKAETENDLKFVREIPDSLKETITKIEKNVNVLDIGCGTGNNAIFLAENGFIVTAIDFIEKALNVANEKAKDKNLNIDFQKTNFFIWQTEKKFKLILDSGCLHNMGRRARIEYKNKLLNILDKDAYYVLIHFGKKNIFDLNIYGPKRYSKNKIITFFEPDLQIVDFKREQRRKLLFHFVFKI